LHEIEGLGLYQVKNVFPKIHLKGVGMISGKVDIFIQVKANHFSPVNPPLFGKVRQKFVLRRRRGKNDNGLSFFIDGFFYRRRGIPGGRFAHGIAGRVDL
ncbi:MAG: hypothetical protein MUP41_13425, partial [Desulfobacterales bacterium]|nr:hypothetical protein [Desulfobacterales bacterium]